MTYLELMADTVGGDSTIISEEGATVGEKDKPRRKRRGGAK